MLKISEDKIKVRICIILPKEWHEKILIFGKMTNCPYEFIIEEVTKGKKAFGFTAQHAEAVVPVLVKQFIK